MQGDGIGLDVLCSVQRGGHGCDELVGDGGERVRARSRGRSSWVDRVESVGLKEHNG